MPAAANVAGGGSVVIMIAQRRREKLSIYIEQQQHTALLWKEDSNLKAKDRRVLEINGLENHIMR